MREMRWKPFPGGIGSILVVLALFTMAAGISDIPGRNDTRAEPRTDEAWMGVYINDIKVGYTRFSETKVVREGQEVTQFRSESLITVSRLGGNPIELLTVQESWLDSDDRPLETQVRTKMSQTETVIKAEIHPDRVVFYLGDKVAKELAYSEKIYFDVPVEDIIEAQGLRAGAAHMFKILDPVAYALSDCRFFIRGEEDVLILGEKKRLWHVTTELDSIIPMKLEEWIDGNGKLYKSETQVGFMTTVALRMSKEKALEPGARSFDIAFSSLIVSNVRLERPQSVRHMRLKLSGLGKDKLEALPWDGAQKLLESGDDYVIIETRSRIFREEESLSLPIRTAEREDSLAATVFCQADDTDIRATAREIVGEERNAWRAAKMIAEWIDREMTANYDVGFASAREILDNREGDCSEHTVLFVALCRASGIPARAAVGIMYGGGIFAYHMWPEVFVGDWVALDPKWLARDPETGEYFTDATHIKFGRSNLDENMYQEMITSISEIIGKLKLEVLEHSEGEFPVAGASK